MRWFSRDPFQQAFTQVAADLRGDHRALDALRPQLKEAVARRDLRAAEPAVASLFARGGWSWPHYQQWLEEQYQRRIEEYHSADLPALLREQSTQALDALCQHLLHQPAGDARRADMIDALGSRLPDALRDTLTARLRRRALQAALPQAPSPEGMASLFCLRVAMTTHALGEAASRRKQLKERPWWMFVAPDDPQTPAACYSLNGAVYHHTDSFWQQHAVPCARLDCRCSITSLNERESRAGRYRQGNMRPQAVPQTDTTP